jgi:hypothetical protein
LLAKRRQWIASAQFVGAGLLANTVGQAQRCHRLVFSRASALLQLIQATSEICDVCKSVGAGLLANTVGQPRRCHRLIFFPGKRAPAVDPGNLRNLRRMQICRGRLAGERGGSGPAMSQAGIFPGKRAPTVDPGNLRNLRRMQICRSRLAGEHGGSASAMSQAGISRGQARSHSRSRQPPKSAADGFR